MGFFDKLFGKKENASQPANKSMNTDYQNKLLAAKQFYLKLLFFKLINSMMQ